MTNPFGRQRKKKMKRRITPEIAIEIAQRYKDGDLLRDIAATYGIARQTVADVAKRMGCKPRGRGYPKGKKSHTLKKARNEKIMKLYEAGKPLDLIAIAFDISRQRVHQIAVNMGCKKRAPKHGRPANSKCEKGE